MLIKKSGHSIVDFSLTFASKTLRIHQRLDFLQQSLTEGNPLVAPGRILFKFFSTKLVRKTQNSLYLSGHQYWANGEIGRRTTLKMWRRNACRFESDFAHFMFPLYTL